MSYLFTFHGVPYAPHGLPDGMLSPDSAHQRNLETERKEIDWLKTAPERVFLYVAHPTAVQPFERFRGPIITTWLGTPVGSGVAGVRRSFPCFGPFPSHRRSLDVLIFGVRYVGWYFESSGNYCRLKKSTRQPRSKTS